MPISRRALLVLPLMLTATVAGADDVGRNVTLRGNLANSLHRFEKSGAGDVAFLGGSITEMNGYRPMVSAWLTERFPETDFTFTNAGISSTCSTTGAFRLQRDVLAASESVKEGGVDLLFVEFAVNDDQDAAHSERDAKRGMEGLLRHLRRDHPRADVVVTYFVNPGMLALIQKGETPTSIKAHEAVAKHYDVSTVYLAREVADRIEAGTLTWKVFGGTHPKPPGNRIAADLNIALLKRAWSTPSPSAPPPHVLPPAIDEFAYDRGTLVDGSKADFEEGWSFSVPDWKSIGGGQRTRYADRAYLHTTTPGAVATLQFTGRGVGAFVLAGPDAGIAEARIDGGDWRAVDLFHHYSKGLHYPRTVMFDADLEPGEHTLELRSSTKKNASSKGHALRIIGFAVNGPK